MTDDSKAIEAAARAIARWNYPSGTERDIDEMWEGWVGDATAAIAAHLAAEREAGRVMVRESDMIDRYTYLAKLGDWAAGEGFCQIEGVEDPEEYIFRAWSQVGPENGDGYTAEALAEAMIAAARKP